MTRRSREETREAEALLASHGKLLEKSLRPSVQPPAGTGRLRASIQHPCEKARLPQPSGAANAFLTTLAIWPTESRRINLVFTLSAQERPSATHSGGNDARQSLLEIEEWQLRDDVRDSFACRAGRCRTGAGYFESHDSPVEAPECARLGGSGGVAVGRCINFARRCISGVFQGQYRQRSGTP